MTREQVSPFQVFVKSHDHRNASIDNQIWSYRPISIKKPMYVINKQDKQVNERFPNRLFLYQEITKLLACYRCHLTSNLNLIIFG